MVNKGIYSSAIKLIGNTPIVRLNRLEAKYNIKTQLYAKLEYLNPLGSVKDRIADALISDAVKKHKSIKNIVIVEASSGNTGIGLAFVASNRGLRSVIVVPEGISEERKNMLDLLGARIIFAAKGIKDAAIRAKKFCNKVDLAVMTCQFDNKANPNIHKKTTAKEILKNIKNLDYFVAGVGTGGTITGVGEVLKRKCPQIKVIAVEPWKASVLSG
ncbi:MAG: PLP-dependent cysteine synthase family protein, partial [Candidatus Hodgkinia cicadicola]